MNNYTSPCPTDGTPQKWCTKCHEWKPATSEYFYRHKKSPDGFYAQCKLCKDSYRHTPNGKQVTKRKVEKWRKTENGITFVRAKMQRRKVELDPLKLAARNAVNKAVHAKKLESIKTRVCAMCGGQAQEYHHWSYEPEHWLDVIPLCQHCHTSIHVENRM